MKKSMLVILIGLLLAGIAVDVQETYDTTELIRFHVLANSDSEADQALKLIVKDQTVSYLQTLLAEAQDVRDSRQIIQNHLPDIQARAEQALKQSGSDESVQIQYGHFDFPIKYYGRFSLPAGDYEALRLIIGSGQGQNWWCVLFPPLCFVDAEDATPDALDHYTTETPEKQIVLKCRFSQWLDDHLDV